MENVKPQIPTLTHPAVAIREGRESTYEELLSADLEWAMSEGSLFFEGQGRVQQTLQRVCKRLDELSIPYAIAGGMALFLHGFRRFIEFVEVLVTRSGLQKIHEELDGRGYVRPFEKSKNLRDADTKVKVEFLVTGQFPGDGKPKPVAFPDPKDVSIVKSGIPILGLHVLVTLKLACWMSNPARGKDFADVQELIKLLQLSDDFADRLNPYVREKYLELWSNLRLSPTRYILRWKSKSPTSAVCSIDDLIASQPSAADQLAAMQADGVLFDPQSKASGKYIQLFTYERTIADKYGMQPEADFFDDDEPASGDTHSGS